MTRVGFIGSGGIAQFHVSNLKQVKDVQFVSFCDVDEQKAKKMAEEFKCPHYTNYKDMLNKEKMDACYVCLPPFAHEDQEIAVCEKGINIFVEKPTALSMDKAKKVIAAIKKNKVLSAVGHQDRYEDNVDRIKGLLKNKKVGLVMGYFMGGFPMVYWWREKKLSGGQAVEQTIHTFDLARYLFGEVSEVYAAGSKGIMAPKVEKCDIEDASAVTLKMKSGPVVTIFSADFFDYPASKVGLDIYTEDLYIEYKERNSLRIVGQGRDESFPLGNNTGVAIDSTFIEAVRTRDGSKIRSPYEDAAKTLEVTLAANRSMETGKSVRLG
ncbi:hypothetical protein COY52_02945 [Candidatus Desantisbacteria bacterium CG_4_10_14_0_8_um_filter_48_22]|uniref:Gfo/Idh/MocA family oxidoreductase n=1 Tax=Candidatus Desantisbacteria bacterium CG_4_10_14_0_8_um_filter_48_22 TaxID=1974543 RepID=A0A2M7SE37_9BACT|nr:MAG: hypothetical protein AUJ67_02400 [Candidatus Desantisbacteria bacterium CG1_02_49_89]PIV57440.1 MAG: hypothetical protein COS16_00130 [Candidatus Desantisbacteria bacterium CG02_land_8_20_14_3_00_49_13]PIZ17778.1 MAG: hypothetical protein COY52_02945 [Candidatus Desantisbacteria bacterium CG_4_10_14_0_8_um_filter_48_22]